MFFSKQSPKTGGAGGAGGADGTNTSDLRYNGVSMIFHGVERKNNISVYLNSCYLIKLILLAN